VGYGNKGGTGEILDRLGQPVPAAGAAIPSVDFPIWADDNQHTCGVAFDPQTLTSTLVTMAPGQAVKPVAVLGSDQGPASSYRIASCSFRNDEAIIVRSFNPSPTDLLALRLSNGQVVSRNIYDSQGSISNVVASADSILVAENSSKSIGLQSQTAPSTLIRRASDRSIVATLDPTMGVLAFNSDDSLVLVYTTPWAGGLPTALAVIDVRSGRTIWTYNGPGMFGNAIAQPGGRDFALYVRKTGVEDPLTDLMIVHADGTTAGFPRRYEPAW
jgi:hypothetical protein